jgi:hypothetical protein
VSTEPATALVLFTSALLALVHLGASGLRFLQQKPRSRWLSLGGGTAVAYVFLHLLPELVQHQAALEQATETLAWASDTLKQPVYLLALLGLAVFYGLERLALRDRHGKRPEPGCEPGRDTLPFASSPKTGPQQPTGAITFWLSMAGFTVYNALIGHLLVGQAGAGSGHLLLFTAAMALHILVNDYGLREHHQRRYQHSGRWVLSAAVLVGTAVGLSGTISPLALALLSAVLAGGVVLNVLKEELPAARDSSFGAFLAGVGGYAAVWLLL